MVPRALFTTALATAVALLAYATFGPGPKIEPDAAAAQRAALSWAAADLADVPRRVGDTWEVDMRRANGSVVEVTLGRALELRELDEELGPAGTFSHDQVAGLLRGRAIAAARPVAGAAGPVRSVERENDGRIEVDFVAPGQDIVEVELDSGLRVIDVDDEDIGDE